MGSIEIRDAYGDALQKLGEEDSQVVVLESDVGSSTRSILFGKKFPERYFNVGIAELHMVSMAAGMAHCGYVPFVNAFAVFLALRAADAVHTLVACDNLNVKLAASYCGYSGGMEGASHQSISDIAEMRAMPNMTILSPCDAAQTEKAVFAAARHNGPVYLRLSRSAMRPVYTKDSLFTIGKANPLTGGNDVTIFATGCLVQMALDAAKELAQEGIEARVVDVHTIKPLDVKTILQCAKETGAVVTAEEHNVFGGLGSAICELLAQNFLVPVEMVGIQDCFGESGNHESLLEKYGLSPKNIIEKAKKVLFRKKELQMV